MSAMPSSTLSSNLKFPSARAQFRRINILLHHAVSVSLGEYSRFLSRFGGNIHLVREIKKGSNYTSAPPNFGYECWERFLQPAAFLGKAQ
jgi:hypothetical protein